MRRAALSLVAVGAVATAAGPALAASGHSLAAAKAVDSGRAAGTTVTTRLPGGDTLQLDFLASELSDGPQLLVDTTRCDADQNCSYYATYVAALSPSAVDVSSSDATAHLATTLDGLPLVIDWRPTASPSAEVGGGQVDGSGSDTNGHGYAGQGATTTVRYDGASCSGDGGVGTSVEFDTGAVTGTATTLPLSQLRLPAGTTFGC